MKCLAYDVFLSFSPNLRFPSSLTQYRSPDSPIGIKCFTILSLNSVNSDFLCFRNFLRLVILDVIRHRFTSLRFYVNSVFYPSSNRHNLVLLNMFLYLHLWSYFPRQLLSLFFQKNIRNLKHLNVCKQFVPYEVKILPRSCIRLQPNLTLKVRLNFNFHAVIWLHHCLIALVSHQAAAEFCTDQNRCQKYLRILYVCNRATSGINASR